MQAKAQSDRHFHRGDGAFLDIERIEHQKVAAPFIQPVADLHDPAVTFGRVCAARAHHRPARGDGMNPALLWHTVWHLGDDVDTDALIAWCRENMANYKVPREVRFEEIPKTSTGKIQKFTLRERARAAAALNSSAGTGLEK